MPVHGQQPRAEQRPVSRRYRQQVQPVADPLRVQREERARRKLDQGLVVVQLRDQLAPRRAGRKRGLNRAGQMGQDRQASPAGSSMSS